MKKRTVILCSRDGCPRETNQEEGATPPPEWLLLTLPVVPERAAADGLEAFCSLNCLAEWAISRVETVPAAAVVVERPAPSVVPEPVVPPKVRSASKMPRRVVDEATTLRRLREMTKDGPVPWTKAIQYIRVPTAMMERVVTAHPQEFVAKNGPKHPGAPRAPRLIYRKSPPLEYVVNQGQVLSARRLESVQ